MTSGLVGGGTAQALRVSAPPAESSPSGKNNIVRKYSMKLAPPPAFGGMQHYGGGVAASLLRGNGK